ncbi:hypothetical protein [Hydrogenophaga sp. 2FB]|uniref:hypothetical protein n=1 Tax=Hydrogenophaga sp. 2FB TaxID=2502187 RepID=UPI0010F620DA|nr:hypothetical protein [Hydrogenophaga sp. 2FB]
MELHPAFSLIADTDILGILERDASLPQETQEAIHRTLMTSAFQGLDGADRSDPKYHWIRKQGMQTYARLHGFASRSISFQPWEAAENEGTRSSDGADSNTIGGRITPDTITVAMMTSLISGKWYEPLVESLHHLLATYAENGYLDLADDRAVHNKMPASGSYLEVAVCCGNTQAISSLMDLGALAEAMPLKPQPLAGFNTTIPPGAHEAFLDLVLGIAAEHPVRQAIDMGRRRQHAAAMHAAMHSQIELGKEGPGTGGGSPADHGSSSRITTSAHSSRRRRL